MERFIWGARAIGKHIGRSERQALHLLETGKIPAKKVGPQWVGDRSVLDAALSGAESEAAE